MEESSFISEILLNRIASGDQRAFQSFYDIVYPTVYRFTRYFLHNENDCEDVVAEVFYIIWKQRDTLLSIQDLKAWLYIVSRNEAYAYLKQKEKYFNISIDDIEIKLYVDTTAIDSKLIEEDLLNILNKAIDDLPERCKLIFLMVREERLKYKEIAHILSITEGTVAQQMHIAIRKIASIIYKYDPSLRFNRRGE
ncbi:MAG: sigma-70 family RNA polymerase sigma factor [Tannerellaceae bacterium]|nr:sigma-70 family RNA polymerase sigma factor [Tannerellaceae bacterium]